MPAERARRAGHLRRLPLAVISAGLTPKALPLPLPPPTTPLIRVVCSNSGEGSDWGTDRLLRSTHGRVGQVSALLQAEGVQSWYDADQMTGDINRAMTDGIDRSRRALLHLHVQDMPMSMCVCVSRVRVHIKCRSATRSCHLSMFIHATCHAIFIHVCVHVHVGVVRRVHTVLLLLLHKTSCRTVIVFITSNYLTKVAGDGARGLGDNCLAEFSYAFNRRGVDRMIAVVLEPDCLDTGTWHGPVGLRLSSHLYVIRPRDRLVLLFAFLLDVPSS